MTFPEGFLWGVATSGHQTEGGNDTARTPKAGAAAYARLAAGKSGETREGLG